MNPVRPVHRLKPVSRITTLVSLLLLVFAAGAALAQPKPKVKWAARLEPADARVGESAQVVVTGTLEEGWHIYSMNKFEVGIPTSFALAPGGPLAAQGKPVQPQPHKVHDKTLNLDYEQFDGAVAFGVPVKVAAKAAGAQKTVVTVKSQACNENVCDPPVTDRVTLEFKVAPGKPRPNRLKPVTAVPAQPAGAKPAGGAAPPVASAGPSTPAGPGASGPPAPPTGPGNPIEIDINRAKQQGLFAFLWLSLVAGFAALLTPCVFPMIPITVSYFAKRKAKEGGSAVAGPLAYCAGIVGTFTGLGLLISVLFGATKVQSFAANGWVNLFLGGLFIVMAANLFGVFEIVLPSSLVNSANAGTRKGGLIGPMLMGLTFTLTSFTCTVPFVGTLLVSATQGGLLYPVLGMLAFSTAFALPFFLLALFPQYLAKLPKSGSWLVTVKAFMGFLELAAALKFLSNVDLAWQLKLITRPVFLSLWCGIFLMAALYLVGWIRLPHDDGTKIGIPRRLIGVASAAFAVWMLAALNGTSLGTVEAFPPPERYGFEGGQTAGGIPWLTSYESGVAKAKQDNKALFINFTGWLCVNCREMEKNVLPHPDVRKELASFVPVELYTDRDSPEEHRNQQLLLKLANTAANPVYAVVSPDGKLIKALEGRHSPEEFAAFLREARASANQLALR